MCALAEFTSGLTTMSDLKGSFVSKLDMCINGLGVSVRVRVCMCMGIELTSDVIASETTVVLSLNKAQHLI